MSRARPAVRPSVHPSCVAKTFTLDIARKQLSQIQYVATTCWFVETHADFILHT